MSVYKKTYIWQGGKITSYIDVIKPLTYCLCLFFTWNLYHQPLPSHYLLEEGGWAVVILQWAKIVHRAEKPGSVPPGKEILLVLSIYFLHFWQWKSAWANARFARLCYHSPCFCYFLMTCSMWGQVCQTPLMFVTSLPGCALGCSVWTSPGPREAMIAWVILVGLSIPALCKGAGCCSPSHCWWALINSICLQSHTGVNLIKLQALYHHHPQAAPACAMSTPGTRGSLMPGAPCRSRLWLPQPVPHPSREV